MKRKELEHLLLEEAAPEARKHRILSSKILIEILKACPESGNLGVYGTHDQIKHVLWSDLKDKGVGFGPIFWILLSTLIECLIRWWFRDKSNHTLALAKIRLEA